MVNKLHLDSALMQLHGTQTALQWPLSHSLTDTLKHQWMKC